MNKLFKLIAGLMILASVVSAQEIGVRWGEVTGGNVAIDAVFSMGQFSRTHADVSFGNNIVGIDLLWDFLYKPLSGEAFRWYAGAGPFAGFGDVFILGVVGELGLEYKFNNVPISISGDWRPSFQLIDNTNFDAGGFGLNVRYVF